MTELSDLLPGDFVQARNSSDSGQVLVTEFTVSSVRGISVYGSDHYPDGLATADGWTFELIQRPLTFPATLSLLDATFADGSVVRVMGMGGLWTRADSGQVVDTTQVVSIAQVVS